MADAPRTDMPEVAPLDAAKAEGGALVREAMTVGADGKPGWKSTEFLKHAAQDLLGFVVVGYGIWKGQDWLVALALGTGCVNANIYALARTSAKKAQGSAVVVAAATPSS